MADHKLTHEKMIAYGFTECDWYYNKGDFTIGFLFIPSEDPNHVDKVDIFYKETRIKKNPLTFGEELEFLYKLITGEKL